MVSTTWRSGAAMADGGGSIEPGIWAPIGAAAGAAGLWLANRLVGKAAVQSALNTGFKSLMEEMRAQNALLVQDLERERRENNIERIAWATERQTMRGEVRNLTQTVESLKALLRRNGVDVPDNDYPRATVEDPPARMTVLRQEGPDD